MMVLLSSFFVCSLTSSTDVQSVTRRRLLSSPLCDKIKRGRPASIRLTVPILDAHAVDWRETLTRRVVERHRSTPFPSRFLRRLSVLSPAQKDGRLSLL